MGLTGGAGRRGGWRPAAALLLTLVVGTAAGGAAAPMQQPPAGGDQQRFEQVPPGAFDAAVQNLEYRIGAGDELRVEVFGLPELQRTAQVDPRGRLSFPLLDRFTVAGLTLEEAAERIERLLTERQLVNEPEVSVTAEKIVSRGVTVQGAVGQPGVYQILGPKTLLELLVDAGGLTQRLGGAPNIIVLRRMADGGRLRTEIDTERLLNRGDLSLDITMQPGDLVLVPMPSTVRVYLSGAVREPGPIEYPSTEGITLLQAITAAGGPTERANLGGVQVIRRRDDGTEERFEVNVKKIRKGRIEDFVLEPNDTVVVKEWFF